MRRISKSLLPLALILSVGAVVAGGQDCAGKADTAKAAHHEKHCSMTAEECKAAMASYKTRGWIGLMLEDETGPMTVTEVVADSPAEQAGFQAGDILVAFNDVPLNEAHQEKIAAMRKELRLGDRVTYTIERSGSRIDLTARLAEMPDKVFQAMLKEHLEKEHAAVASK